MSQTKKFKVGDLVEYTHMGTKGIGIVYAVHDTTDGIYDTERRFFYSILTSSQEGMPLCAAQWLKKIKV